MNFRVKIIQYIIGINENFKFYPKLRNYYLKKLKNRDLVIFDVGSNKGQSIDFFLNLNHNCTIHSFEPNKKLYEKLIHKYKSFNSIIFNNKGVSNLNGQLTFYENIMDETSTFEELNYESTYLKKKANILGVNVNKIVANHYNVDVIKLADYINKNNLLSIDVLKIDVEGHELACLQGLFDTKFQAKIAKIQLESHDDDMYKNNKNHVAILELLNKNGFFEDARIKHGFGNFYEVIYVNKNIK